MRSATRVLLVATTLAIVPVLSRAQNEKPIDYRRKSVAQWIEVLQKAKSDELQEQAQEALGPDGPYAQTAIPALINALARTPPDDASDISQILARYGHRAVPGLIRALKRPEASVRAGAASTLGLISPKVREAVPGLINALMDPVPEVRAAAASGLANVGPAAEGVIPALIRALHDPDDDVRLWAAQAFWEFGRKSKPAIQALIAALKDKNDNVRARAAQALWRVGPPARAAVPSLIEGLRDKKRGHIRWTMAQGLWGIGPDAKDAVPALAEAAGDKDDSVAKWAAFALGKIGPAAKAAVPALLATVENKNNPKPDAAIEALGDIGPAAAPAVPALLRALTKRPPVRYRDTIATALGGIGPPAKPAVPALAALAVDRLADSWIRKAAAVAVMRIDPIFAAKHHMETAYLNVRLGQIPRITLAKRTNLTKAKKRHIQELITALAQVKHPDFGMSGTMTGEAFAPLPQFDHFEGGLLTGERQEASPVFRELVAHGPDALPFLLAALADARPTKLKIEGFGMVGFGDELAGNHLNPKERRIVEMKTQRAEEDEAEADLPLSPYTIRVGDVCFVAIGQIVGRPYRAMRFQPSVITVINSPVAHKELRERVRAIWQSSDPAQKLLDSLLLDFATRGLFNGKSLAGWSEGSDLQIQAAVRLLYYFPRETAPLIATRLRALDVHKTSDADWMAREVKNGAHTVDFIKAVAWCQARPIRAALAEIAKRTDDPEIRTTVVRSTADHK